MIVGWNSTESHVPLRTTILVCDPKIPELSVCAIFFV